MMQRTQNNHWLNHYNSWFFSLILNKQLIDVGVMYSVLIVLWKWLIHVRNTRRCGESPKYYNFQIWKWYARKYFGNICIVNVFTFDIFKSSNDSNFRINTLQLYWSLTLINFSLRAARFNTIILLLTTLCCLMLTLTPSHYCWRPYVICESARSRQGGGMYGLMKYVWFWFEIKQF